VEDETSRPTNAERTKKQAAKQAEQATIKKLKEQSKASKPKP
jgi:hypothetical protein